jgi:hypothetical protein
MVGIPDTFTPSVKISVHRNTKFTQLGHERLIGTDSMLIIPAPAAFVLMFLKVLVKLLELLDDGATVQPTVHADPFVPLVESVPHVLGLGLNLPCIYTPVRTERESALRNFGVAFPAECPAVGSAGQSLGITPTSFWIEPIGRHSGTLPNAGKE